MFRSKPDIDRSYILIEDILIEDICCAEGIYM